MRGGALERAAAVRVRGSVAALTCHPESVEILRSSHHQQAHRVDIDLLVIDLWIGLRDVTEHLSEKCHAPKDVGFVDTGDDATTI